MRIAIGSDHAGYRYKGLLIDALGGTHDVRDFGTYSADPVDYPRFVRPVAEAVARGEYERGIVLGGSGNGEAMAANRVRGVRCSLCWTPESARLARAHNDANVLSLGERMVSPEEALAIVRVWLETPFEGGRHVARIALLDEP
jgi:ribose 5-phosphate isomerase B